MRFIYGTVGPRDIKRSEVTRMRKFSLNRSELSEQIFQRRFLVFSAADGWRFNCPKWWDLYWRPHQHLGWPVTAEWFPSNTLSRCPTVSHDICTLRPSIGSSFFVFFFIWEGRVHHTPHKTLRFLSSTVAGPWERIGHEVGPITPLTFTKILRFVKGRRWSICWLEGTEVSCQSWGFGLNIKSLSLLFCQNGPF